MDHFLIEADLFDSLQEGLCKTLVVVGHDTSQVEVQVGHMILRVVVVVHHSEKKSNF